jgi:beta-glucosidase
VVSDCAAIADVFLPTSHGYVKTAEEAFAVSIKAGHRPVLREFGRQERRGIAPIVEAVRTGLVSEAEVDQAVRRLFEARLKLGLFDPPGAGRTSRSPPPRTTRPPTAPCRWRRPRPRWCC